MTTLRRTLLTLLAVAWPGAPQAIGRRWTAAAVLGVPAFALGGLLAASAWRAGLVNAALDPAFVDRTGWVLAGLGVLAAVSVTETAIHVWARPGGVLARGAGVVGVVLLAAAPATAGTAGLWYAGEHRAALERVFRGGSTRVLPSSLTDASIDDADTPATARPRFGRRAAPGAAPTPATAPPTDPGRWNILLLGGDAGRGRSGLRTDAMILLSVDRRSGDTAMVSIPRNLARLPMPPGALRQAFPRGWNGLANAFYGYARNHPELGDGTDQAAEHALTAVIAEALGVPVDNYVLVDMGGFIDVVDALGGVDVTLSKRIPAPGNPYEAKHAVRDWFGPGRVHLDGTDALAYARSRDADSDYGRMARQRCLLATAARQVGVVDILLRYDDLLRAMERSVVSDLTPAQARQLVDLYGRVERGAIRSLGLVPPLVDTGAPKYDEIRRLVAETLDPAAWAAANPPPPPPVPQSPATTEPSRPAPTTAPSGAVVLDESSTC
jgi:LCP family protein required for cell wall assembly